MDILSLDDFEEAGRTVLSFLHKRLGFDLWMLTRTEGKDWIVLQTEDHGYNVTPGTVFRWADSFCSRMVRGEGPRIAPSSALIPAYNEAPIGQAVQIAAYVGFPLVYKNGNLFGTLCAIDPLPQPDSIADEQELVELLGSLLNTVLQNELLAMEESRRAERIQAEAQTDVLTGLINRRGWNHLLEKEEERCRRYGHSAAVLIIDLDGLKVTNDTYGHAAGDELLQRTGTALRRAVRLNDVVARLSGDEFAILALDCNQAKAQALQQRVQQALLNWGVDDSVGLAVRDPAASLAEACQRADFEMYRQKQMNYAALQAGRPMDRLENALRPLWTKSTGPPPQRPGLPAPPLRSIAADPRPGNPFQG